MSDIKFYDLKEKTIGTNHKLQEKQIKDMIEKALYPLLGLRLLASDFVLDSRSNDKIETLAIDENYQLVIIEYRIGKFGKIINKGLVFVDYIKQNLSIFKMLVNDKFGVDVGQAVSYEPRLIIIGDDFNRYDNHAIKQMNTMIELIKFQVFDKKYLILEKNYQSMEIDHNLFNYQWKNQNEKEIYKTMNRFLLSLGDEVVEFGRDNYLMYRKIKTFMFVAFLDTIEITLIFKSKVARSQPRGEEFIKTYQIKTEKDFLKICDEIEMSYDQNWYLHKTIKYFIWR